MNICLGLPFLAVMAVHAAVVSVGRAHLRREALGVRTYPYWLGPPPYSQPSIAGDGEGNLVQELPWACHILDLRAVVGVDARASGEAGIVFTQAVVVPDEVQVRLGAPQNLSAQPRLAVVTGIRLPAVDEPRLDLQLRRRELLNAKAVEEPGRVGGDERRLIGPVVEVVVAEQADVGDEDAGVQVEAVVHIPVISAPCLGDVLVSVGKIPLAAVRAAVVARRWSWRTCRTW